MNTQGRKQFGFVLRYAIPVLLVAATLLLLVPPYPTLAVLPGLAILGLLWFGRRDMVPLLFYGIVLLIPFGAYRGLGGAFSFVRLHWMFAIALIAFVLIRIVLQKKIPPEVRQGKFWAVVLLFYIVNILAALGSKFPETSTKALLLLGAGFLLVALGMIVVDQKGFSQTLPRVIVGSIFAGSLLAVLGAAFNINWFVRASTGRALGAASDPNNMSLMIIFSLPLVVYFLLTARRAWARAALLLVMVINVMAIIATFSRGGALVLAIALLLMLWEFRRQIAPRNLGLLLGLGGLAVVALLLLAPEAYTQRIKSIKTADDFAMRRRASYIVAARDLVAERPLLGSGPNTFSARYVETDLGRSFMREKSTRGRKAHNTYVEVLVGSGVVGLVLYLIILGVSLKSFSKARQLFLLTGRTQMALLTTAYRTSFLTLLVYLLIYSEVNHKYYLLSLALSQIALRLAQTVPEQEPLDVHE